MTKKTPGKRWRRRWLVAGAPGKRLLAKAALMTSVLAGSSAWGASVPALEEVPEVRVRLRVLSVDAAAPAPEAGFRMVFPGLPAVAWKGGDWSPPAQSTREAMEKILGGYPNRNNRHWQVSIGMRVAPVPRPKPYPILALAVETSLAGDGETNVSRARLFGPRLGLLLWKDASGAVHADTHAGHGRRVYDDAMQAAVLPPEDRPKKIIFAERYIGGDDDLVNWFEGVRRVCGMGFNALHPVPKPVVPVVREAGISKVWGAVYNPPGYAFNFAPDRKQVFDEFVDKQTARILDAGWRLEDIACWVTSDEPGWYYPEKYEEFSENPAAMAAFRSYLQSRGLTPSDLGWNDWTEVRFAGRADYESLPERRLFYWSNRFFPWASSRFFGEVAEAYERRIYPGLPVIVNFNNFLGRLYQPGPVGNNKAKQDPNAAMGQHDWLEFGRMRGMTCMATEDWFGDAAAPQWSFYASRLRSAAEFSGVGFGALVIPRVSGQREWGMAQKLLALVGHGSKTINFFTFGPEYNFPGNCWSENPAVFAALSKGMKLVARAEDLLYPGHGRRPEVAILTPQSAQLWDLEGPGVASGLLDVTNNDMFRRHMAYMSETYGLFLALAHRAVPVRFVDEIALRRPDELKGVQVLYVTAPDIPISGMEGLLKWVKKGGTLVLTAGSGVSDRYHQPSDTLLSAAGVALESAPARPRLASLRSVEPGAVLREEGETALTVFGAVETLSPAAEDTAVLATFEDGRPAVTVRSRGRGRIMRFACFPGISYCRTAERVKNDLPRDDDAGWRRQIFRPVAEAGVELPVRLDRDRIEAPALYSDKGIAVTLLNWSGTVQPEVGVTVVTDRPVADVALASGGEAPWTQKRTFPRFGRNILEATVDIGDVDVLMIRYGRP